jgi:hypothetical protein
MQGMVGALKAAGHSCKIDKDGDGICDSDRQGAPTFAVVYAEDQSMGPYMGFVASFRWKDADGCAKHAARLVELTGKLDLLRLSCTPELMTFAMTSPVPERGFTTQDVTRMSASFVQYVRTLLNTTELVKSLQ